MSVFVSSSMMELPRERQAIETELEALGIDTFVFETDIGARPESIRDIYRGELRKADLYVGVFGKKYGKYTIDEYEYARIFRKDPLIYIKRLGEGQERAPQLQRFLDERILKVESGHTYREFDTPEQLAAFVKEDVATWHRRQKEQKPLTPDAQNRHRLINDLWEDWIEDALKPAVAYLPGLDVAYKLVRPHQDDQDLPPWRQIFDVFDERPFLFIQGAGGVGKTITLLELARALLLRAEADPVAKIPAVLNLSHWIDSAPPPKQETQAQKAERFENWLVDQIKETSLQTEKKHLRTWLQEKHLLLLLDGLDELQAARQQDCAEAISAYVKEKTVHGLVVCSRRNHDALPKRLRENAIVPQPLSRDQVTTYLDEGALAALRHVLDTDAALQELVETPLMLRVMSEAYRGKSVEEVSGDGLDTVEARRHHIFETYIDAMFRHRETAYDEARAFDYDQQKTLRWLSWLATKMQQHGSPFLVERIQPNWLDSDAQRWLYALGSRLTSGLVLGLATGLILGPGIVSFTGQGEDLHLGLKLGFFIGLMTGVLLGLIDGWRLVRARRLHNDRKKRPLPLLINAGIPLLVVGVFIRVMTSLIDDPESLMLIGPVGLGIVLFIVFRERKKARHIDIQIPDKLLPWSWQGAQRGGVGGLGMGAGLGLLYGLVLTLWKQDPLLHMLSLGLVAGLIGGVLGSVFGGLRGTQEKPDIVVRQRIKLALRNVGISSLVLAGVGGLVIGVIDGAASGAVGALFFGLVACLWYGGLDLVQHYTLRLILFVNHYTPRRYGLFLEHSRDLIFLHRIGDSYTFIHRLLRKHFADLDEPEV